MAAPTLNAARNIETARALTELFIGDVAAEDDATGKFGWGVTPVGKRTTFTETYNTAHRTLSNATYAAVTITTVATSVAKTNSSPYGFSTGDADKVVTALGAIPTDLAALNTALAALAADVLQLKKNLVAVVQDQKALGFVKAA